MVDNLKEALKNVEAFAEMGMKSIAAIEGLVLDVQNNNNVEDQSTILEIKKAKENLEKSISKLKNIKIGA